MKKLIIPTLIFTGLLSITGCASHERNPYMTNKRYSELHVMQMKANEQKKQDLKLKKQKRENELKDKRIEEEKWNLFSNDKKLQWRWKKAEFTPKEAIEWKKYLTDNELWNQAGAIKNYIRKGLTLSEVKKWKNNPKTNKLSIYDIHSLSQNGFTVNEVSKWYGIKFNSYRNEEINKLAIKNWKKAGFTSEEAREWTNYGYGSSLEYAKDCKKLGFTPEEAKKWVWINKNDCSEQAQWRDAGFIPKEYINYRHNNFSLEEAKKWKKVGYAHAAKWINYNQYAKNKYTPDAASKWVSIGVLTPQEADTWKETKLKESTIKKFVKKGVLAKTILKLQKVKAKPTKLTILMAEGNIGMKSRKDFLTKLKILKKNHCKTIDIIHVKNSYLFGRSVSGGFHNIDEYNNKGKCYQFTGSLIQRLDRKHGLVQNGSFLYYTTFNQSWREGTEKTGVLKGQGAYKYITTEGSRKIIPKGKVLFFDN